MLPSITGFFGGGGTPASTTAYESIATVTVGSGGASSAIFSGIPSGYSHLQIRSMSLFSNARLDITFNGDTSSSYSYHLVQGAGASAYAEGSGSVGSIRVWPNGNSTSNSYPNLAIIDILDYANTSKNKTARILNGFDQNGSGIISLNSGAWFSTSAITSITLAPNTGTFQQYSSFALYGVK